jgi:D-alanyl-D-alanine dipeptidase
LIRRRPDFFNQHSSVNTRALSIHTLSGVLLLALFVPIAAFGQGAAPITESNFVDIKRVDPTILIDLRYASPNNFTHRPLYPPGMPAMVRFSVAQRLAFAQKYLKAHGYGLKIWDAYRPRTAQQQLWEATRNNSYVADPKEGIGSMHTRGAAVDATLVNRAGREVAMPTEFDNFTPAAMLYYQGPNPVVRSNLNLLQKAMARAGFYGLRTEWWHFCAGDWTTYPPVPEIQLLAQALHPGL